MRGAVWCELEVDLPADEMWAALSSPNLPRVVVSLMPTVIQSLEILEGDGRLGTVFRLTYLPSIPGPKVSHDKFVEIDHETRTKVSRTISGGYLDLGFTLYESIYQIIPRGANACTFKSTFAFDVKEGSESNASTVASDWEFAKAVKEYALQQK